MNIDQELSAYISHLLSSEKFEQKIPACWPVSGKLISTSLPPSFVVIVKAA